MQRCTRLALVNESAAVAYIDKVTAGDSQRQIEQKTGIGQSRFSRNMKNGTIDAEMVITVARAYGKPVILALHEAGFLTQEDMDEAAADAALTNASEEDLLREVLARVAAGSPVLEAPITPDVVRNVGGRRDTSPQPIDLHSVDLSGEYDLAATDDDTVVDPNRN